MRELESLLRAARDSEAGAWGPLDAALRPRLIQYFKRWFDPSDAEELAQQTLFIVTERLAGFEPRVSLRGWVFGIARHLGHDEFRDRDRRRAVRDIEQVSVVPETGLSTDLAKREIEQIVIEEVAELPGPMRKVIEHDLDDGDPEDFAERENISRSTMRTRRHRGITRLQERVEDRCKTPPRTQAPTPAPTVPGQSSTPASPPPS